METPSIFSNLGRLEGTSEQDHDYAEEAIRTYPPDMEGSSGQGKDAQGART